MHDVLKELQAITRELGRISEDLADLRDRTQRLTCSQCPRCESDLISIFVDRPWLECRVCGHTGPIHTAQLDQALDQADPNRRSGPFAP
jgi:hypothetical protein